MRRPTTTAGVGHGSLTQTNDSPEYPGAVQNDTVERPGDRKFLIVLHGLRICGHVSLAAQKIERIAAKCAATELQTKLLKTSIGIAMFPEQREDESELMRLAEVASLQGLQKNESISFYEP